MNKNFNEKKNDYLLELALEEQLEYDEEMSRYSTDSGTNNLHQFSDLHNKKMKNIFKQADKIERHPQHIRKYRQLAASFIIFFCLSTFTVTHVDAFRTPLLRFFSEIKNQSTFLEIEKENDYKLTTNFSPYEPQYIPKGFSVLGVTEDEKSGTFVIQYINDTENETYTFYFFSKLDSKAIDTEDCDVLETEILGNKAMVVQKSDEIRILLMKDNHQYYLNGTIPISEAYKIMESLR